MLTAAPLSTAGDIQYNIRMTTHLSFKLSAVFLGAAIAAFSSSAQVASAYNPTNTTAKRITDNVALFTITVPLASSNRSVAVPVHGTTAENPDASQFAFDIFSDTSGVFVDAAAGIIVSDATIVDNEYVLEPGEATTLTIVMLALASPSAEPQQLRAQVNNFPIFFCVERESAQLTKYELGNYVTPKITLR